jgi:hypothetical protein
MGHKFKLNDNMNHPNFYQLKFNLNKTLVRLGIASSPNYIPDFSRNLKFLIEHLFELLKMKVTFLIILKIYK